MDEAEAWATGNAAWLAAHYERLIARTMREQGWRRDPDADDLAQEARLALLACIRSFDPARGHKFSSYAIPRIVGAIQQYKRTKATWVRRSGQRAAAAVQAATTELELRGEPITDDAIRARLDKPGDLERARRLPTLSHLTPALSAHVAETLPDPQEDVPGEVWERSLWQVIVGALDALPWLQREAVRGVDVEGRKASEVARGLGIRVTILRRDVLPRGRKKLARLLGWSHSEEAEGKSDCQGRRTMTRRYTYTYCYRDTKENADALARLAQERGVSTAELLRRLARKEAAAAVKSKKGDKP